MIVRRKIFDKLEKESKNRKVSLLVGARQVGKTTLLKELFGELSKTNKCLFLDLDVLSNYEKVASFESLINTLKLNGYEEKQKEFFYLFLDEFQKYPSITRVMKNVYDNLENVKIYASGSSSLTMKNQAQESLAGRKNISEIYPLDFEEFLVFRGKEELAKNLTNISKLKGENLSSVTSEYRRLFEEFMIFGGYPEVALKKNEKEKIEILRSIFDLYVKKDLVEYLNIEKILSVKKLIEFLAVNNGQKIRYEEISGLCGISLNETKKYLEILSETYLLRVVRPFFSNKNKELVKIPKVYFIDNGVRNYFINNFNRLGIRQDAGYLFEGAVLSELIKQEKEKVRFWNNKNSEEVDFVIEEGGSLIPIEVKFREKFDARDLKGLENFLESYPDVKRGKVVNLAIQKKDGRIDYMLVYSLRNL